ncbi:Imm1 family immunity protein [Polymorphospora rubra]|uniref:Imm1 family immunity protein n=1 Tax=Polymorphospora rubra TaxID=338584 RepID=UPI0033CE341B
MKFAVQWGRNAAVPVATVEELDTVLDHITDERRPQMVNLFNPDHGDPWDEQRILQIGLGNPDRSFAYLDPDQVWAVDPTLEPASEPIWFNYGGTPTEYSTARTRIHPATARQAARDFLTTDGQRPGHIDWQPMTGQV